MAHAVPSRTWGGFGLLALLLGGVVLDRTLAHAHAEAARWVSQAAVAFLFGWWAISLAVGQTPAPLPEVSAQEGGEFVEPVTRRGAVRRGGLAPGLLVPLSPLAARNDTSVTSGEEAACAAARACAAAAAERVLGARLGVATSGGGSEDTSGNTLRFAPLVITFPYPWEAVMAAQRDKLRPPNDPNNPTILSVSEVLSEVEGEDVIELGLEVSPATASTTTSTASANSKSTTSIGRAACVRRRTRDIESSIVSWVPMSMRWAVPVESITLREELSALPQARWAVLRLRSTTLASIGLIQDHGVYTEHPERPGDWTQWTGYLDLSANGFIGRQVLGIMAKKGGSGAVPGSSLPGAPSAAGIYASHIKAINARLLELYGAPRT